MLAYISEVCTGMWRQEELKVILATRDRKKRGRKEKAAPMSVNLPFKATQAKRCNMSQALKENYSPGISC